MTWKRSLGRDLTYDRTEHCDNYNEQEYANYNLRGEIDCWFDCEIFNTLSHLESSAQIWFVIGDLVFKKDDEQMHIDEVL